MFDLYTVIVPERLDQLANRLFGEWAGVVESILDANAGLADEGLLLTVGRVLRVPRVVTGADVEVVRLWS